MAKGYQGGQAGRAALPLQLIRRFQEFARLEAASGLLLLGCTIVALMWANSPWAESYGALWETPLTVRLGGAGLEKTLLHWINDGLMALFFFVVGLEIKREVQVGELSSPRQALFPIAAALGGMLIPAAIYSLANLGGPGRAGWGIPMATDIAFALGVLALLGGRAPLSLKIFLTALAIVDDIGAVLVIALFYSHGISWISLALGLALLAALALANRAGVRATLLYALLGGAVWIAFLKSGVHATVAGVLVAMTIPSRTRIGDDLFLARGREILDAFEQADPQHRDPLMNEEQYGALQTLETLSAHMQAPMQRMEHALHPWVSFVIMPIFALANAGVPLDAGLDSIVGSAIPLGIVAGLVLGKPLGITLFCWLAVRLGLASRPADLSWKQIHAVSWLGGIGFTMSLFIAGLAFQSPEQLALAKVGILAASLCAGILGWVLLRGQGSGVRG